MLCACLPQASDYCCKQANNVCARAGFVSKTQRGLLAVSRTGPAPGEQLLCTGLCLRLPVPGLISRAPVPPHGVSFPGGSGGKESACDGGDPGSIPGSRRSPGEGNGTRSSILAWRIPWTEEPGGLQYMWSQRVRYD